MITDFLKTETPFEIIDDGGRVYVKYNCNIKLLFQDSGETLKVFIDLNKE